MGAVAKQLRVGEVFPHLLFKRRQARGLFEEQDAKTSKSPKRKAFFRPKEFFLFLFSPPLIFSFLKRNKNHYARKIKDL